MQKHGNRGVVDYFGERKNILMDRNDAKIGDFVYAQGGVLVSKIPQKQATEILNGWEKPFFDLKAKDNALAKPASAESSGVAKQANKIRQESRGNACCVHGIIEFSNCCKNNCLYCGIRKDRKIKRYRMSVPEIIKTAKYANEKLGFKAIVFQSGEDYWYTEQKLISIVKAVRKMGILVILSVGERTLETYKKLYKAGARGALMRFETSNQEIFKKLKPESDFKKRLALIKSLKKMGYILATGFLFGLPGETEKDIQNNIALTKSLKPDMYSFGPFIPVAGTPLEKAPFDAAQGKKVLKIIASARMQDHNANILITTAMETIDKNIKKQGLMSGANSLMINLTPRKYGKLYRIYENREGMKDEVAENINKTKKLLYSLGRAPVDFGVSSARIF